jgi:hypothetical protein
LGIDFWTTLFKQGGNNNAGESVGTAEGTPLGLPDGAIDRVHEGTEVGDTHGPVHKFEVGFTEGPGETAGTSDDVMEGSA